MVTSNLQILFVVVAFILFVMGGWSRWWTSPQPYYPAFISSGLAFLTLGVWLVPWLIK